MKKIICVALLSFAVPFAFACGDSTSDGSDGTEDTTSGSQQNCESAHLCINGSCKCTNEGKKDDSCSNDDDCVSECRVCS